MPAPSQYIAFLRAINVGKRMVKMTDLRRIFERSRFEDVGTYIGSGNVIFRSPKGAKALEPSIEAMLEKALGFSVLTFLRTPDEVAAIAASHPFRKQVPPGGRLFVGFMRDAPPAAARRRVMALATATDEFAFKGREVYWLCKVPSMQSIRLTGSIEKTLERPATLRNINTVAALASKYPPA